MSKRNSVYRTALMVITALLLTLFMTSACSSKKEAMPTTIGAVVEVDLKVDRFDEIFDPEAVEGKMAVWFLATKTWTETKSGDATLIKTPNGKYILVDGGAPESAHQVKKYLDTLGVTELEAIIASHPHIDHVGGLSQIIYKYGVNTVYRSSLAYESNANQAFLDAVEINGIETFLVQDGLTLEIDGVTIEFFNPLEGISYPSGFPKGGTAFINDNSVVAKFTYKESTLLLPGDLYVLGEMSMIRRYGKRLQADILKMSHHGDDSSNSPSFIKTVKPKIAVAEFDRMASLRVYSSYRKNGAQAYLTAIDGNIRVIMDGTRDYEVLTQLDRDSDLLR